MMLVWSPIYFCGFLGLNIPEYAINTIYFTQREQTMGFSVLPTSVGGVSLNSLASPLAALLNSSTNVSNLTWPSDLGSNPAMGHAVVFQTFDRKTQVSQNITTAATGLAQQAVTAYNSAQNGANIISTAATLVENAAKTAGPAALGLIQAAQYQTQAKGSALSTVSLFMPENVSVSYNSNYSDVSMTQELGLPGIIGNAISDYNKAGLKNMATPYATALGTQIAGNLLQKIGVGADVGTSLLQSQGITVNPQMQLIYRGINLREFQLEFLLTPKSSQEAQTIKNICDTFTYYSLPGIAGAQDGLSGQYLTPPQIWSVQFLFLGQNNVIGNVSNVISSALTNSGLGFLTSNSNISNGNPAKTFMVNDCVLESVDVNYTPNGWATYNDGYPVQTLLTLRFKETQMLTKNYFNGSSIQSNYNNQQAQNSPVNLGTVTGADLSQAY
jgi:Tail-tube assembly protein